MKCLIIAKHMTDKPAFDLLKVFDPQEECLAVQYLGELGDFQSLLFVETALNHKQISNIRGFKFIAELTQFSMEPVKEDLPF